MLGMVKRGFLHRNSRITSDAVHQHVFQYVVVLSHDFVATSQFTMLNHSLGCLIVWPIQEKKKLCNASLDVLILKPVAK